MGVAERREREKEQRRSDIMDAAERVFFAKGIDQATMDDVAETAELSKGLLYFYFKNKNDLCHAIVHRGLQVLQEYFHRALTSHHTGIAQTRAIGEAYVRFAREYPDYFNLMAWFESEQSEDSDPDSFEAACEHAGDKCIEYVAGAVRNGIEDGTIRSDLDPLVTAMMLWGQTHGLIQVASYKETRHRQKVDADRLLEAAMAFIEYGLSPHP